MVDFGFPNTRRLRTAFDYRTTFQHTNFKVSNKYLLMLAHRNELVDPRVGVIVSKKNVKLAVRRNRVKRLVRESFRQQENLPNVDIVVLARFGIDKLSNQECSAMLTTLWQRLLQQVSP